MQQQLVPAWGQRGGWGQPGAGTCQQPRAQHAGLQAQGRIVQPPIPLHPYCTVQVGDPQAWCGMSTFCIVRQHKILGDYRDHMLDHKHNNWLRHSAGQNPQAFWTQVIPARVQTLEFQVIAYNNDGNGLPP